MVARVVGEGGIRAAPAVVVTQHAARLTKYSGRRREPPTLRDGRATERTTVSGIAERTVSTIDEIQGLYSTKVNM